MGLLDKIKQHISGHGDKEFRKQVLEEKKQKYLFSDDLTDKYRSSRMGFFSRKKRSISPYTSSFADKFTSVKRQIDNNHILGYIGLLLLALSGYVIFLSPYFRISPSHVLLEARNDGIDVSVAYRSIEDIYGKSIFRIDEEAVATMLKRSIANLSHVTIDKLYPSGVKILMTSTPIVYQARISGFDREWRMSNNGVLIPRIQGAGTGEVTLLPIEIISETLKGELFFEYKQIISDERMLLINKIVELFAQEWGDMRVEGIRYFAKENELHLTLVGGTVILLTLEADGNIPDYNKRVENIRNQLLGLKTYIEEYRTYLTDGSITYIDARIVKKIFLCRDKNICRDNLIRLYGDTYRPKIVDTLPSE